MHCAKHQSLLTSTQREVVVDTLGENSASIIRRKQNDSILPLASLFDGFHHFIKNVINETHSISRRQPHIVVTWRRFFLAFFEVVWQINVRMIFIVS